MENSTELCHSCGRGPRWPLRNPSPVDEVLILTKGAMVLHPHPHPGVDLLHKSTPAWKTVRLLCAWVSKHLAGYKRAKAKCFQDSRATHKLVKDWGKGLGPEQDTSSNRGQILGDTEGPRWWSKAVEISLPNDSQEAGKGPRLCHPRGLGWNAGTATSSLHGTLNNSWSLSGTHSLHL